jgi:co-chaperonin GroES (HSP10)
MAKLKMKPVSGYTLIESKTEGGTDFVTSTGEKVGAKKVNIVVAVSEKDTVEWKVGDKVAVGENGGGFAMEEDGKKYILLVNSSIIAVL